MNQQFRPHKASKWPPDSIADRHHSHSDDLMVDASRRSEWTSGYVDRYDHTRGYGFIISDMDGQQNFLHRSVVIQAWRKLNPGASSVPNFIDLPKNHRVSFTSKPTNRPGGGRDDVVEIKFLDPLKK